MVIDFRKNIGSVLGFKNADNAIKIQKKYMDRIIQDQKYISSMDEFYNKYLEENK